jgi:hypothetical protein
VAFTSSDTRTLSCFSLLFVFFDSLVRIHREPNTRPPNLRIAALNLSQSPETQAPTDCWLAAEAGVLRPLDPLAFSQISLDFEAQRFVEVQASILLWFSNAQVLFSNPAKESLGFKARSSRFFR